MTTTLRRRKRPSCSEGTVAGVAEMGLSSLLNHSDEETLISGPSEADDPQQQQQEQQEMEEYDHERHTLAVVSAAIASGSVHRVQMLLKDMMMSPKQQQQHPSFEIEEEVVMVDPVKQFMMTNTTHLLIKALDRCCPEMLQLVLRYIPATHRFVMTHYQQPNTTTTSPPQEFYGGPAAAAAAQQQQQQQHPPRLIHARSWTALDYLLDKICDWNDDFDSENSEEENDDFVSETSGEQDDDDNKNYYCGYYNSSRSPPLDDFGHCLWLLLDGGATYTHWTMRMLSLCLGREDVNPYAFRIAQICFGNWLPDNVQNQFAKKRQEQQVKLQSSSSCRQCSICWNEEEDEEEQEKEANNKHDNSKSKMITLYCGHTFCVECIEQWGASEPERLPLLYGQKNNNRELTCPMCRKPLPRKVLSYANRIDMAETGDRKSNVLGIDYDNLHKDTLGPEQIATECRAQGLLYTVLNIDYEDSDDEDGEIKSIDLVFELAKKELRLQFLELKLFQKQERDGTHAQKHRNRSVVDMGSSKRLSSRHLIPTHGPVVIPIRLEGCPILAGISGLFPYTIVSSETVQLLGLKTTSLTTDQYDRSTLQQNGIILSYLEPITMAVLDEVVINLGTGSNKIEVRLRNAMVQVAGPADPCWRPGIVLGKDFLSSATWTASSVDVNVVSAEQPNVGQRLVESRRFLMLGANELIHPVDDMGLSSVTRSRRTKMPEEFRFYSANGKTFRTPLFHVDPRFNNSRQPYFWTSYRDTKEANGATPPKAQQQQFTECEWCCRMFPLCKGAGKNTAQPSAGSDDKSSPPKEEKKKNGMICANSAGGGIFYNQNNQVYYCDRECQQKASRFHRHRNHFMDWCRNNTFEAIFFACRFAGFIYLVLSLVGVGPSFTRTAGNRALTAREDECSSSSSPGTMDDDDMETLFTIEKIRDMFAFLFLVVWCIVSLIGKRGNPVMQIF